MLLASLTHARYATARTRSTPHFAPSERESGSGDARLLKGLSVLVVDDHEDMRDLVEAVLRGAGATVVVASSAAEALAIAKAASLDVIVSDIGMPEKDGYELIREVREISHHAAAQTPAIALTAYGGAHDRARALEAGFQEHVLKPCSPEKLVALVRGLALTRGHAPETK